MTKNWGENHDQQKHDSGDPKTLKQISARWPRYRVNQSPRPYEPKALGHENQRQEYNHEDKPDMNESSHEMGNPDR